MPDSILLRWDANLGKGHCQRYWMLAFAAFARHDASNAPWEIISLVEGAEF